MKSIVLMAMFTFFLSIVQGQSRDFKSQRAQLTAFNIGFNGLVGGVGGLINKEEDKTGFQAFAKGFYQGAIGGAVSHVGFSLTHQIEKRRNISFAWPARLVNSFGSSIIQNSAEGKRMFERLHLNLYVTRLDYHPYEKQFKVRFFTSSIYGIIQVGRNAKFNLSKSLQSGILHFESDQDFTASTLGFPVQAIASVSSIGMKKDIFQEDYYKIYAEETAHIIQFDRKVGGNALLFKFGKRLSKHYKIYKSLSKYIYFDLNGPIFWLVYKLEGVTHECNLFEQEAVNYSNRVAYRCN